jgi:hypothetical protein
MLHDSSSSSCSWSDCTSSSSISSCRSTVLTGARGYCCRQCQRGQLDERRGSRSSAAASTASANSATATAAATCYLLPLLLALLAVCYCSSEQDGTRE